MDIQFFQCMFEKHNAIMVLIDPINGQIIASNQAASCFYGYSIAHMNTLNMKDIDILPPTELAQMRQAIIGQEHNHFIVPHRLASGEIRTVEIHASLIAWEDNQLIFSIIHDITTHKQKEEDLRTSEERWQFALEAGGDGVWDVNLQTYQTFHSRRWKEILGYNEAATNISFADWEHHLHPDDRATFYEKMAANLRGETPYYLYEHRVLHQKGFYIWILARGKIMSWTEDGKPLRIVGTITDITARKQAEDKLKKLTQAVEQSSSSIMITNVNRQIEFVNQGFMRITGYTSEEVMGQNPRLLRSGHHSPEFYQEIWATIAQEGTWRGEILNRTKNGELFWGLSRISAIKNAEAQVTHYIAVNDNITPRKQLEIQLKAANEQLMQAYDETLEGWARALDLRDKETKDHSHRVMEMTVKFAQRYGLPESDLIHIRRGALLHDIGKMGIPDNILRKQGPLDEAERLIMRLHPLYAYEMLQPISYLQPAIDIPYCHHEKWDGTGYPRGLMGEEIPLAARLFALVDVWDALSFNRPYRLAWSKEKIQAYILAQSGFHFDPQLVPLFLELWGDNSFIY